MKFITIVSSALVASSALAVNVGGPKGDVDFALIKREFDAHQHKLDARRRHHVKRQQSSKKCKHHHHSSSGSSDPVPSSSPSTSSSSSGSDSTGDDSSGSYGGSSKKGGSSSGNSSGGNSSSGNSTTSSSGGDDTGSSSTSLSGISGFQGDNSGIGSWFRTNSGQDSTNGRSWCQLNYQDSWMGFAPDVSVMLNNFGGDTTKAGTAYCGLEAKATAPNGNTALIYIVDGFDPKWVRTPGSIDLTLGAFKALYGSETSDKNIVIQDLQWEFTGNRKSEYEFNSGS